MKDDERGDVLFTGQNPIEIAAQGVDFTIVGNHTEWMRQRPLREGIGRETLVD